MGKLKLDLDGEAGTATIIVAASFVLGVVAGVLICGVV